MKDRFTEGHFHMTHGASPKPNQTKPKQKTKNKTKQTNKKRTTTNNELPHHNTGFPL